jgi:P4 family phage/plasmid primase-like protien
MTVPQLYKIFGDVPLLPIPSRQKSPQIKKWETITLEETKKKSFQNKLAWFARHGNIGVRQGPDLQSIDIDDDELAERFLEANPALRSTAITKARRGVQIHVKSKGSYPNKQAVYKLTDKEKRTRIEWRCGGDKRGSQSVVSGIHPDGMKYRFLSDQPVVEIDFDSIVWPEFLTRPWLNEARAQKTPVIETADREREGSAQLAEQDLFKRIEEQHGSPIQWPRKNAPALNEPYFAGLYAAEHYVLFEADEQKFYQYDDRNGLYHFTSEHQIVFWLAHRLLVLSRQHDEMAPLEMLRSARHLSGVVRHLKGHVEEKEPFATNPDLIHVANGVLDLSGDEIKLLPFSPELKSRNGIPINYVKGATAKKFVERILVLLSSDDRVLLLKFIGQFLTGRNLTQKILILYGLPDTSKSTLAQIIKHLIGERNCTELRTKHLANRFEIGRLYGRTLVIGADVSARFLDEEGAYKLKAIVGGDMLDAEKKCSNVYFTMVGDFNVLLTSNSRLTVRLSGDRGAWERRLAMIEHQKKREGKRIDNFARLLIKQEGPGVLNMALDGLKALRVDLQAHGDVVLTDEQRSRVKSLLDESDGLRLFLKDKVQTKRGANLTTDELVREFSSYCAARGWTMNPFTIEKQLPAPMLELFTVSRSNDIKRENDKGEITQRKGYHGITWRPEHDEYDDEN